MRKIYVAFTALALAIGTGVANAQAPRIVKVGTVSLTTDIAFFLAEKRGYFKQEGIQAEFVKFDSGAKMIAPLGTGQLDVGGGATSAGLYNAVDRGIELKIVADKGTNKAGFDYKALLVNKTLADSGKFSSLADLKGKKVAVVAKGAADESVLNEALKKAGLKETDVEKVYMGFSQQPVAFEKGAIDAAISGEPTMTRMLRAGTTTKLAGVSAFYPVQQTSVVLYSKAFSENRELGTRFARAYLRGVRDYMNAIQGGRIQGPDSEAILDAMQEMTGIKDRAILKDSVAAYIDPNGQMDLGSLKTDHQYFVDQGLVKKDGVGVDSLYDTSFIEAAARTLGRVETK